MEKMMLELSANMARINEGIWRDEFAEVALAAEGIAEHPLPPLLQRLELLAELGADASRFMDADKEMKAAAMQIRQAAEERRIDEVISRYQVLQQRCVACHAWYRDPSRAQQQNALDETP